MLSRTYRIETWKMYCAELDDWVEYAVLLMATARDHARPPRPYWSPEAGDHDEVSSSSKESPRKISNEDLFYSVSKLRESKVHCGFLAPKMSGVDGLD